MSAGKQKGNRSMGKNDVGAGYIALKIGDTLRAGDQRYVDFVRRLRGLANQFPELPKPFAPNKYTRDLVALDGRKVPVDVYCVLAAFPTGSSAIDHAVKKLLAPGQRGQKDRLQDLKEARASLDRAIQMEGG